MHAKPQNIACFASVGRVLKKNESQYSELSRPPPLTATAD